MALPSHLRPIPLRRLMCRLRKWAPVSAPVRLVQRRGVRCNGEWVLGVAFNALPSKGGKVKNYRIVVESRLTLGEKWEVVVHEWAHCLDRQTRVRSKDCHDSRWGQCYAKAFRASLKSV